MSQDNQYETAPPPGPGYSPPGPGYPPAGPGFLPPGPVFGQPGPAPQKTNTMAILGLVFAFVFSPLGIAFSAIGLSQAKKRNEGGRGLAIAGLVVSIVFVAISALMLALVLPAVRDAAEVAAAADTTTEPVDAPEDPHGVVAACEVIVPAVMNLESDMAEVTTPEQYAQVMSDLRTMIDDAAANTTDPTFTAHVQKLSEDFQKASDAVAAGQDPSFLESALSTDGTAIDDDCATAGYR